MATVPIELYKIVYGSTTYRFTSSDTAIVYGGETFLPETIGRGAIESKGQITRENLEVSVPVTNDMARDFLRYTPDALVFLTVLIQSNVGTFVGWKGRLSSVKTDKSKITLVFESIFTSMKASIATQSYQRGCRHMLYGSQGCKVNKNDFLYVATATGTTGYIVALTAPLPNEEGYYTGGVIEYNGAMRGIMNAVGNSVTINDVWPSLNAALALNPGGLSVNIYPGCDRAAATCKGKFDNYNNFGGFPNIPTRNPFEGSIA